MPKDQTEEAEATSESPTTTHATDAGVMATREGDQDLLTDPASIESEVHSSKASDESKAEINISVDKSESGSDRDKDVETVKGMSMEQGKSSEQQGLKPRRGIDESADSDEQPKTQVQKRSGNESSSLQGAVGQQPSHLTSDHVQGRTAPPRSRSAPSLSVEIETAFARAWLEINEHNRWERSGGTEGTPLPPELRTFERYRGRGSRRTPVTWNVLEYSEKINAPTESAE